METTNGFVMARPMMSFSDSAKTVWNKYAVFTGRARRSESWWWFLLTAILGSVTTALDASLGLNFTFFDVDQDFGPLNVVYSLIVLLPNLAVTIRRLHDINYSGWYFLFVFIPLFGLLLMLWWTTRDSQRIDNEYGPSPKYYTPDNNVAPAEPGI